MILRIFFVVIVFVQNCFTNDFLFDRVRNFVGDEVFKINKNFIEKLFSQQQIFFRDGVLDNKKVLETLKNNGLMSLKFNSPKDVSIVFSSHTSPIFLLRSVNNALASMGYSYFEVKKAEYENNISKIIFSFTSEYMIDPLIVIEEMNKRGFIFNKVKRINMQAWEYDVDILDSKIANAKSIEIGDSLDLKEVSGEYWLQIFEISGNMNITANSIDWKPKIIFFDKNLHIIDILKKEEVMTNIAFNVLKDVRFILISDAQNPINIKNGIKVIFSGF
ncbi:hypothetical protein LW135_00010 [Helicobacter sp. faydin-H20]|uniref:hypothetical protein n=1 Tax=Helicobacter anatolicus TaxID=2905874 RepID=UPI001E3ED148|nr:hypothetical protein [Helicobacter anatolicus]MCE3036215.1 hypothetical protein [Helicobacter anatolicus]